MRDHLSVYDVTYIISLTMYDPFSVFTAIIECVITPALDNQLSSSSKVSSSVIEINKSI